MFVRRGENNIITTNDALQVARVMPGGLPGGSEELGPGTYVSEGGGAYLFRMPIAAASFSINGSTVEVQLRSVATEGFDTPVTGVYIGEKAASGDAWDMEGGTISQFLFSASSTVTLAPVESVWSDELSYSFDKTKDYIISLGITDYLARIDDLVSSWYKADAQAEAGNADVASMTENASLCYVLIDMRVSS